MSNIQEKIQQIQPYFQEMNVVNEIIYVLTIFPTGWGGINPKTISEHFGVTVVNDESIASTAFYFWAPIDVGFDNVFDSVKFIVDMNEAAQRKMNLMNEKIIELKNIFINEEDIALLETLTFTFNKPAKKKRVYIKKSVEETIPVVEEPVVNENEPEKIKITVDKAIKTANKSTSARSHKKEKFDLTVVNNKSDKNIGEMEHVVKDENIFSKEELEKILGEEV